MNIDYTVTALMFPAIPLLMSVYSNRFHTLSKLIRELHDEHVYEKHIPPEWKSQFINLSSRITIIDNEKEVKVWIEKNNLLVIELFKNQKEVFIPFVKEIVPLIDIKNNFIIINPPNGL